MVKEKDKPWYKRSKFLRERQKWYAKLEKAGFEDIEHTNWGDGEATHQFKAGGFRSAGDVQRRYSHGKVRYYELACQRYWSMVEEGDWPKETLEIWQTHANGASMAEIHRKYGVSKAKVKIIEEQRERFKDYAGE